MKKKLTVKNKTKKKQVTSIRSVIFETKPIGPMTRTHLYGRDFNARKKGFRYFKWTGKVNHHFKKRKKILRNLDIFFFLK